MNANRYFYLKRCPFCGEVPSIDKAVFKHNILSELQIHCCCYTATIENELLKAVENSENKSEMAYLQVEFDDDPVDIWNSRITT